jgi:hypothetical protein
MDTRGTLPNSRFGLWLLGLILVGMGTIPLIPPAAGAQPAAAPAGERYGGIEIGAKGIKAVVLRVVDTPDGLEASVLFSDTANCTLVGGTGGTGRFDPDAVKQTVAEVGKFYHRMRETYKVDPGRIFIVGSSGLFSGIDGKEELIKVNKDTLTAAIDKGVGAGMSFVSDRQEAELSIVGIVPRRHLTDSVLVDIGSGNTKGGSRAGAKGAFTTFSVPFGSVTFTDLVKQRAEKSGKPFPTVAEEVRQEVLLPALTRQLDPHPDLRGRKRVYLSGGMIWALATLVRPGDRSAYTELTAADVETFRRMVRKDPGLFPEVDLSGIADAKIREEAAADLKRVQGTWTPQNLVAGGEVLAALSATFDFAAEGRKVYFARYGHLGWILAFVAERTGQRE